MRLPEIVTHNFGYKLLAFLLAAMIWFAVYAKEKTLHFSQAETADQVARTLERHPLTVMKSAADARGFRVLPSEVNITVVGPAVAVQQLSARDIQAFINLTGLTDADELVRRVQVYAPPQIRATEARPPDVRIELVRP
jgi:YbbR domain-containing protein